MATLHKHIQSEVVVATVGQRIAIIVLAGVEHKLVFEEELENLEGEAAFDAGQ